MAGRLQRFFGLPWRERLMLAGSMFALPLLSSALRVAGYGRTRAWIERMTRRAPAVRDAAALAYAQRVAALADIAGRRGAVAATCLPQALLVYGLLRRRGLAPTLELGARSEDGTLGAHAWVEVDGVALGSGAAGHRAFKRGETATS
jgi:hypothetical protein